MEDRGRIHLNANDKRNLYKSKKSNLRVDLHHNQNHNIFDDGYTHSPAGSLERSQHGIHRGPVGSSTIDYQHRFETDKNAHNPKVLNNSPSKRFAKMGALYNPNKIDPRRVITDPGIDKPAGVTTNYGYT